MLTDRTIHVHQIGLSPKLVMGGEPHARIVGFTEMWIPARVSRAGPRPISLRIET